MMSAYLFTENGDVIDCVTIENFRCFENMRRVIIYKENLATKALVNREIDYLKTECRQGEEVETAVKFLTALLTK